MRHAPAIRLLSLLLAAAATPGSFADDRSVDPKQIILDSAAACKKVETIAYVIEDVRGTKPKSVRLTATFRQARAAGANAGYVPGKYAYEGSVQGSAGAPIKFAASYDGAVLRIVDHAEKAVKVAKAPQPVEAAILLGAQGVLGMPQFSAEEPFKFLLERNPKFEYRGVETVKGVVCHAVTITQTVDGPFGKQELTATWFIGREDRLPHGIDYDGRHRDELRILRLNDPADAKDFALRTPEGYAERTVTGKEPRNTGLLAVGSPAPAWTLKDPDGRERKLSDYRGKVVVLDFWGTWCVPCRKAMPHLQALHDKYKDRGVVVLGVAVGDDEGDPAGYMKREKFTYGLLLKGDQAAKAYRAQMLPTIYILDKEGRVAHAESGLREAAKKELPAIVERCLGDGKSAAGKPETVGDAAATLP